MFSHTHFFLTISYSNAMIHWRHKNYTATNCGKKTANITVKTHSLLPTNCSKLVILYNVLDCPFLALLNFKGYTLFFQRFELYLLCSLEDMNLPCRSNPWNKFQYRRFLITPSDTAYEIWKYMLS